MITRGRNTWATHLLAMVCPEPWQAGHVWEYFILDKHDVWLVESVFIARTLMSLPTPKTQVTSFLMEAALVVGVAYRIVELPESSITLCVSFTPITQIKKLKLVISFSL